MLETEKHDVTKHTGEGYSGEIKASFIVHGGVTKLQTKYHKSPLKIAKTFTREKGQLGVCVMDCSPGMMAGDRYRLEWLLGAETSVFLNNQSTTKIHPSRERPCEQKQTFTLERNAFLQYRPEPIMLFKDANYSTHTNVYMEQGAVLFYSDIVCSGRALRGELFQYAKYESSLHVFMSNEQVYANRQVVEPKSESEPVSQESKAITGKPYAMGQENEMFTSHHNLGSWENHTHQGTFYLFSDRITKEFIPPLRRMLLNYPHLLSGVSLTYKHGIYLSILGKSAWELQQPIQEAWEICQTNVGF